MKYIKPIFLCIFTGFFMGFFLYSGYEKVDKIVPTIREGESLLFLKIGSYADEEKMEKALKNIDYYIYRKEESMFHAYIGITEKKENAEKMKEYYQKKGYVTNVEVHSIANTAFLSVLKTYDEMLLNTEDSEVMENIIQGVLSKYEEMKDESYKT